MGGVDLGLLALAWLLTYLVHSTLLLGGTWLLVGSGRIRSHRWRDRLWKLALVGGVLTASVQVSSGLEPFGGLYALGGEGAPLTRAEAPAPEPADFDGAVASGHGTLEPARPIVGPRDLRPMESPRPSPPPPAARGSARPARAVAGLPLAWRDWTLGLWVIAGAAGIAGFAWSWARLLRLLAGRREIREGALREMLDRLSRRAGMVQPIRLTRSSRLTSPITMGIVRTEICVPSLALTELTGAQQEAMLAHEVGHAVRRDPAWLSLCWLLETALFLQPLNRLARRKLQQSCELLCDDWAVRLTGHPLSLASCLTEIARWMSGHRQRALPAPSITDGVSPLGRRIERLLGEAPPPGEHSARWWLPSAVAVLVLLAGAAPGFSFADRIPKAPPVPTAAQDGEPLAPDLEEILASYGGLETGLTDLETQMGATKRVLADLTDRIDVVGAGRIERHLLAIEHRMGLLRAMRDRMRSLLPRALKLDIEEEAAGTRPAAASQPRSETR